MELKSKKNIAILDYGFGNTGSLKNFITKVGFYPEIVKKKREILNCDILVIPGVGSAVNFFKTKNIKLINAIKLRHKQNKPILGICLGAQIFFDYLFEVKKKGLRILSGEVKKLNRFNNNWMDVNFIKKNNFFFKKKYNSFYFNHEYFIDIKKKYTTFYTKDNLIPAMIIYQNLICVQFHPEKSQKNGIELFKQIVSYFNENITEKN